MTEQPMNDTPPQEDTPQGDTPQGDTPQEHTPPRTTPISAGLRATLATVFVAGFLHASAGQPVEDTDTIPVEVGAPLHELAMKCIEASEALIAELYPENPQTVYRTLYDVGYQAAKAIEQLGTGPVCSN